MTKDGLFLAMEKALSETKSNISVKNVKSPQNKFRMTFSMYTKTHIKL